MTPQIIENECLSPSSRMLRNAAALCEKRPRRGVGVMLQFRAPAKRNLSLCVLGRRLRGSRNRDDLEHIELDDELTIQLSDDRLDGIRSRRTNP